MIGETISHYKIVGQLGEGGMGVVYEAQDTRLPRRVALKVLPEELASDLVAARRFKREAEHIARLNHPRICTIYEVGDTHDRPFIAMERLEGLTLKEHLKRGRLLLAELLDIALQITDALTAAHAEAIVHRDIKPSNIFIEPHGTIKVLDFGLAKRFIAPDHPEHSVGETTFPGRPIGTPNYMAPERIRQDRVDHRSDLFSLGVVIYQMATERLPFGAPSVAETVGMILDDEPVPIRRLTPDHPVLLEQIITRLLAKAPDDRYQSAAALAEDLRLLRDKAGAPLSPVRLMMMGTGVAAIIGLAITLSC